MEVDRIMDVQLHEKVSRADNGNRCGGGPGKKAGILHCVESMAQSAALVLLSTQSRHDGRRRAEVGRGGRATNAEGRTRGRINIRARDEIFLSGHEVRRGGEREDRTAFTIGNTDDPHTCF